MKKNKEEVRRVEKALIAAHSKRNIAGPDGHFVRDVMFEVWRKGEDAFQTRNGIELQMAWRFAAVSCILAFVFLVFTMNMDFSSIQYDVAQAAIEDPSTVILTEAFAVI